MDLLITVFSLLVAIYASFPRERRLDLRLRFGTLDALIFAFGVIAVAYLDLYTFFKIHGLVFTPPKWSRGFTKIQASHVVLVTMLVTLGLRSRFARLTRGKITRFQQLADELLWSESYLDLLFLFEAHLPKFFVLYHGDGVLQRFRAKYAPQITIEYLLRLKTQPPRSKGSRVISKVLRPLLSLIPEHKVHHAIVVQTAHNILQSKGFVSTLARARPYLGLEIITNLRTQGDKWFREEFVELFMTELLSNHSSVYYTELANSRNMSGMHRYSIPANNRLLTFLLSEATIAQELEVYRPVGNFVLKELDRLSRTPESDDYNLAFTEDEMFLSQSPLFAGVHFFDLMVSEALFQNITWHMWLYYCTNIVEKTVRNYKPARDPSIREESEFPIWYSRLLHDIFDAMRNWIVALEDVPATQENIRLTSTRPDHQNDNIPKSSILAVSVCVRTILLADNLHGKLKDALMSIVFRTYFELRCSARGEPYAEVLREALAAGGFGYGTFGLEASDAIYRTRLRGALLRQDRFDYLPDHFSELETFLS